MSDGTGHIAPEIGVERTVRVDAAVKQRDQLGVGASEQSSQGRLERIRSRAEPRRSQQGVEVEVGFAEPTQIFEQRRVFRL